MEKRQAKELGLTKYNTGRPCKRGHRADRYTSSGMCKECLLQRGRDEYWSDPDKARKKAKNNYNSEYQAKYYVENKEHINARNASWLECNADRKKEIDASYRLNNQAKIRSANAKWALENPEKRASNWRNRDAVKRAADGTHRSSDVMSILSSQGNECVYCGVALTDGYHVDHIMPLALGGSNWPSNLQCLCPTCNLRKGAKHPDAWHDEIGHTSP